MKTVTPMDRAMRIMGGLVLIVLGISIKELNTNSIIVAMVIGLYSLITGLANFCPLAYLISIEKSKKRQKTCSDAILKPSDVKTLEFFKDMTDQEIQLVLASCRFKEYAKDHTVISEGVAQKVISIIYSGQFKLVKWISQYEEKIIGTLADGDSYGEMSFFDELPPCVSVISMEAAKVLEIDEERFEELVAEYPVLAIKLQKRFILTLNSRIRALNEQIKSLGAWVVHKRSNE